MARRRDRNDLYKEIKFCKHGWEAHGYYNHKNPCASHPCLQLVGWIRTLIDG